VVVPDHPGVASAFGLVVSDCRVDIRRAHLHDVDTASPEQLSAIFIDLEDQARSVLEADRSFSTLEFKRHLDLRYVGQSWTLPVDVVGERIDSPALSEARAGFDALHAQSYGFSVPEESVEIVNVAVTATGRTAKPSVAPAQTSLSSPMPHGVRDVFFGQAGAFIPTKVFRRERLTLGYRLDGPLLLESLDSTIVVPPEWQATSTAQGLVQLDRISAAP
jgi:N-methylhydantoinase A